MKSKRKTDRVIKKTMINAVMMRRRRHKSATDEKADKERDKSVA